MRDAPAAFDLVASIRGELSTALSPKRRAHSEGAALAARGLATRFGLDADKAFVAALAHDLCKELEPDAQYALARRFPGELPSCVFENDRLPHGPAAAVTLAENYGIVDRDILEAVAYHTVGRAGMGELALVVYCADKIEPGRGRVSERVAEAAAGSGVVGLTQAVVADLIEYYLHAGKRVAPETVFLYNDLLARSASA